MKDVIISVKGIQSTSDAEDEVTELVTGGEYSNENGEITLSYMESELTGLEGTKTTFKINKDLVTLTREGMYNSQMIFEEGRRHFFLYETPFGATTMGVSAHSIETGLDEHGGDMEISYAVDIENVVMGHNTFHINVREANRTPLQ